MQAPRGPGVSALTVLRQPPGRQAQLAATQTAARRWVEAKRTDGGPLWRLLVLVCDDAPVGGRRDHGLEQLIKHGMRYLTYLREHGIAEARAFDRRVVKDYQRYVASLRREESVPPPRPGAPATERPRTIRRAAVGDEPRLEVTTQQLLLNGVKRLWEIAEREEFEGFDPMPSGSPTATLVWPNRVVRDLGHIEFSLGALLATPFVPARGRSRFEHERNLLGALLHASLPTRNAEIRETDWSGVEVWEFARGEAKPRRRWPIEAALTGEVALDDTHRIFITVGKCVPTKSDEYRGLPLIGAPEERLLAYARTWVESQFDSIRYMRYRNRSKLSPALRPHSDDLGALRLLIGGKVLTVRTLVQDTALFRSTHTLRTPGRLESPGHPQIALAEDDAVRFRDLLWAEAASERYGAARKAFVKGTPIRDVFWGALLPSRLGGPLSEDQHQKVFSDMGWTAKGWTAQRLRQHAAQAFLNAQLDALSPLGGVIGHKDARTTLDHYARTDPWVKVRVCEMIEGELLRRDPRADPVAAIESVA